MFLFDAPIVSTPETLAVLVSGRSRCEIVQYVTDDETGNPLSVRCGSGISHLGHALKGVSIDKISNCSIMITINAVHFPKLLRVDNCSGDANILDIGKIWKNRLAGRQVSLLEYVTYEKITEKIGCYKVTITFDAENNVKNTPFRARSANYCARLR